MIIINKAKWRKKYRDTNESFSNKAKSSKSSPGKFFLKNFEITKAFTNYLELIVFGCIEERVIQNSSNAVKI